MNLRRLHLLIFLSTVLTGAVALPMAGGTAEAQDPAPRAERAPESSDEGSEEETNADAREVAEGDSKVKVFRFSGLDISGRLKSPQLLYFLNRLRAEFDRPKLPHRSFMPEMERSTRTKGL